MTAYPLFNPTSLIVGEDHKARGIVLASGAGALVRGTVLGRVTASDKYVPCVKTANDGSQAPVMVLAGDTDATSADVATQAYDQADVLGEQLVIDASWTIDTLEAALRASNSRIYVRKGGALG